jgi:predicted phosphodiesterase
MKVLIYSDVHGNLPAFEKMINTERDIDSYICLGDLVNYGPWSNECVDLALSLPNSTLIMGNHEEAFINGCYPSENLLVQDFFKKTYSSFNRIDDIKFFLEETLLDDFVCRHTINSSYIYPDTNVILDNNYIIGHSHHQFKYNNNGYVLFNTGSVGQNRKYINEINYLVYDTMLKKMSYKSILYDISIILNKMKDDNYPEICLYYYMNKSTKLV